MIHLLQEEKKELRKTEIQNLKNELTAEKNKLEKEILDKLKEFEKLKVRYQILNKVNNEYSGDGMQDFEDNFLKPISEVYKDEEAKLNTLTNKNQSKIQNIANIIFYIDNDLYKQ